MENGDVMIRSNNDENAIQKWWQKRSKREKKGIYTFSFIIISLSLILLVYFFLLSERPVVCTSPECYSTALEIASYIDEKQKPCDDFYRFACGKFLKNDTFNEPNFMQSVKIAMEEDILSDLKNMLEESIDPEDLPAFNLAKQFYKACMDEEAIEKQGVKELQKIFDHIGGWPILEGENWKSEHFDWRKAVRNLRAFGVNFDFFFNVSVDIDREHPERYILGIHDKFFSPSEISPNSKVAFLDYMVDVASQFNPKSKNLWEELNDVLNFLLNLAKISEMSKKANKTNLYNPHTLPELQSEFRTIPWYEYLQGVLGSAAILTYDDIVSVSEPLYIKQLENLLLTTNKSIVANFMGWQTIQLLINYLPPKILDKAYEYLRKVNGQFSRKPRWTLCVEATRNRLSPAINLAYIERYFDEDIRANVTDLIRNVKNRFKKNILMLEWLDEETKRKVIKTLLSSVEKIFSYDDLLKIIEDTSAYDKVDIDESHLLKSVLDLDLILWDQHYSLLGKPVTDGWTKSQTFISGLKVTYSPNENKLKFPLGLFRGIYYDKLRPDFMNYGLLGSILAHQIAHVFVEAKETNTGESKTPEESLLNWWSPHSFQKYAEKLECLSNQYANFKLEELDNIHANSLITRDEDIADLAGFKIAYDTYVEREWTNGVEPSLPGLQYSPRQLFWISSALQFCSKYPVEYLRGKYSSTNGYQHSPNEFRVNGPLQNLDEFSYDFGCSHGSYMNPHNKCYIW